jgi:hypothetical protein
MMRHLLTASLVAALAFGAGAMPSGAKNSNDTVYIATGLPLVSYSDQVTGAQTRDYVFSVKKGKRLVVVLSSKHDEVFFRVYAPDGSSIWNSRKEGSSTNIKIDESGRYRINVHLRDVEGGHTRHYSLMIQQK